jgi:L-ascorbate metabolism protein UlaG (beta-lactamase superfamily)
MFKARSFEPSLGFTQGWTMGSRAGRLEAIVALPVASAVQALLRPRARHVNDVSTWQELDFARFDVGLPPGLELAWLGTEAATTFYHQGSANLLDDCVVHRGVDYFLAGIAGRGYTRDYAARILKRLEPRVIVPQHFDDFFRPLDQEMGFSLNVNFGGFVEEVRRVSADFQVRSLAPLQVIGT